MISSNRANFLPDPASLLPQRNENGEVKYLGKPGLSRESVGLNSNVQRTNHKRFNFSGNSWQLQRNNQYSKQNPETCVEAYLELQGDWAIPQHSQRTRHQVALALRCWELTPLTTWNGSQTKAPQY